MASLNHIKENDVQQGFCETPKSRYHQQVRHMDDSQKYYSPYGAGDGQNNYCQQGIILI